MRKPACLLILWLLSGSGQFVSADAIESLFSPGALSKAHGKFEKDCNQCHDKFDQKSQDKLCLDCHDHKDIKSDIQQKKGFHGKSRNISRSTCNQCHREHEGKDKSIVHLNAGAFNHELTDFPLKGQHVNEECKACHKAKQKYRQAPTKCYSCHKKNDVHEGELGEKCEACHGESSWKKSVFNHDRKTDFPLKGKHRRVACAICHTNNKYQDTPTKCNQCHALNDVHGRRFGNKCEACHKPEDWKEPFFDHKRDAKYALTGKHKKLTCESCHSGYIYKDKLKTACVACHRNDDEHKGRNGEKCQSCHSTRQWGSSRFDHNKKTDFPLQGKHKNLPCESCHKGAVKEEISSRCYACHKHRDVHKTQMGKDCEKCHNESDWVNRVFFEHDITRFPLIGIHAVTPCEECHGSAKFKSAPMQCIKCHKQVDEHKGRFGTKCDFCHNPNSWKSWLFDHARQTDFKLDGAHEDLHCDKCHRSKVKGKMKISMDCSSCHGNDDIHRGRFGRNCERCHDTTDFSKVNM